MWQFPTFLQSCLVFPPFRVLAVGCLAFAGEEVEFDIPESFSIIEAQVTSPLDVTLSKKGHGWETEVLVVATEGADSHQICITLVVEEATEVPQTVGIHAIRILLPRNY